MGSVAGRRARARSWPDGSLSDGLSDPRCSGCATQTPRGAKLLPSPRLPATPPEGGRHLLRRSCGFRFHFRQGEAAKPSIQAGRPDRAKTATPGGGRAPWASLGLAENGRWTEVRIVSSGVSRGRRCNHPTRPSSLRQVEQAIAPCQGGCLMSSSARSFEAPKACDGALYMGCQSAPILTPYRRAFLTPLRCCNQGLSRRS